jgi:hypothetical protein
LLQRLKFLPTGQKKFWMHSVTYTDKYSIWTGW